MTKTITPVNVELSEREARYLVDLINRYSPYLVDEEQREYLEFAAEAIIDETVRNYGRGTGGSWEEKNCVGDHMRGQHGSISNTECPFCE